METKNIYDFTIDNNKRFVIDMDKVTMVSFEDGNTCIWYGDKCITFSGGAAVPLFKNLVKLLKKRLIMKSENKLQDAIRKLDWMRDDLSKGIDVAFYINEIKQQLHEFMIDNERTPKKHEFNIWDWVCVNDEMRPVMNGVFHDKEHKVAVATNAHMLVVDTDSYDESKVDSVGFDFGNMKSDRPINKYGEFIDGRFPNYRAVIPQQTDEWVLHHVDLKELDEYIKKCDAYIKMQGYIKKYRPMAVYRVGDVWFNAEMFRTMIVATNGDVYVKSHDRAAVYWSDKRTALIMPVRVDDNKLVQEAKENGMYLLEY